jgi:hypothetical protein
MNANQTGDAATSDGSLLVALATLLLEVYFSIPIDQRRATQANAGSDTISPDSSSGGGGSAANELEEFSAVFSWLRRDSDKLTDAFNGAVTYCLQCYVNMRTSWRDARFRLGMVENVLVPLINELQVA